MTDLMDTTSSQHYVVVFSTTKSVIVYARGYQDAADRARLMMRVRVGANRPLGRIVHLHAVEAVR